MKKETKYDREYAINLVERVKKYCETYGEWPKNVKKENTPKEYLSCQLYKELKNTGYLDDRSKFIYLSVIDGKNSYLVSRLDSLYLKYAKDYLHELAYLINKIAEIRDFCMTYGEWPRREENACNDSNITKENLSKKYYNLLADRKLLSGTSKNPTVKVLKESNQLSKSLWQIVVDQLDPLYYLYNKNALKRNLYFIKLIREIEEYCSRYSMWISHYDNPKNSQEMLSSNLYYRLYCTGYFDFSKPYNFNNILGDDGKPLRSVIDNLYIKYNKKMLNQVLIRKSQDQEVTTRNKKDTTGINHHFFSEKLEMVSKIRKYCEQYGEWPKCIKKSSNEELTEKEKLSNKYYTWLIEHDFLRGAKNSYICIKLEQGGKYDDSPWKTIITEVDKIYISYNGQIPTREESFLAFVSELYEYCKKRCTIKYYNVEKRDLKLETLFYKKLQATNYIGKKEFIYPELCDENGTSVLGILNYLKCITKILPIINDILWYCEENSEWPSVSSSKSQKQEKMSKKLYAWIKDNRLFSDFRYGEIEDFDGNNIRNLLLSYHKIYAKHGKEEGNYINIWYSKDSRNKGLQLYYYLMKVWGSIIKGDTELYGYYKNEFLELSNKLKLDVNIDTIEELFKSSPLAQKDYFWQQYTLNSIANNEVLAILYKNMYLAFSSIYPYKNCISEKMSYNSQPK